MTGTSREFVSIDPASGEHLARYEAHDPDRVNVDLDRTVRGFRVWRDTSTSVRADFLTSLATAFTTQRERLAQMSTAEMGKPVAEARAEIDKCAWTLSYYAEYGPAMLEDQVATSNASESYIAFQPLGVILAVMPWNYPYWQVVRFAAGALLTGNSILLKHAENVTGCGLLLEDLFVGAGAPDGLLVTSLMPIPLVHEAIADDRIAAVTLTGSTAAGRSVAGSAGQALKKSVLELGGSDAFVVLADADLEAAATFGASSRFQNAGQTCIAAKRFIVEAPVLDEFTTLLVSRAQALVMGDPSEADTTIGPLARDDLRMRVAQQVHDAVQTGAKPLTGGNLPDGPGWFYPPTVLAGVDQSMVVFNEEVFGPVAPVIEAPDADTALDLANRSTYGLGGNIWTTDIGRAKAIARRFESGSVFINGMTASDARLPFGGVKASGYGRELSAFGISEFANIKTIWVGPAAAATTTAPAE